MYPQQEPVPRIGDTKERRLLHNNANAEGLDGV